MALSDDQKALLRLLAQREHGYEDIAALKGKSVAEVREEVREALAALDAPPPEPPPPAPPEAAPPAAAPPAAEPRREQPPASTASRPARPTVPVERRRLVLFTGGALGLVAVVLAAIALIGGDPDSGSDSTAAGTAAEAATAVSDKVTQAVLTSPDGGEASGNAIFGRLGKDEIVLQVTAEGLEPSAAGEPYMVWLYRNPKLALRIGPASVDESGRLAARFPIPPELLAYVAGGAFNQVYVSRTSDAAYKQAVARAKADKSIPRYTGETVLTGEITGPITKQSG